MKNDELETLFSTILADEPKGKEVMSSASVALDALGKLSNSHAKTAYDFLEAHLTTQRKAEAQASFIHTLTKLSKQFGFSAQSIAYCRTSLAGHHEEKSDNDGLYSAYVDYLSNHNLQENTEILQNVNTPWALTTLCRNLQTADKVPLPLLQHAVAESLGNYDGGDGMPHDDAVALLLSQHEYVEQCCHLIFAWWHNAHNEARTDGDWDYREIDNAIAFTKILKDKAQPMLAGLQQALDDYIKVTSFISLQEHVTKHMRALRYPETQIQAVRLFTRRQLIDTYKELMRTEHEVPAEYQNGEEQSMIDKISEGIVVVTCGMPQRTSAESLFH